jgi:hypothetical protein
VVAVIGSEEKENISFISPSNHQVQ